MGFFPQYDILFKAGRFIFGLSGGAYGVFCGKYINETAPTEIKGALAGLIQMSITLGILVPFVMDAAWSKIQPTETMTVAEAEIYVAIVCAVPIIFATLQILLFICVFKYHTPVTRKQKR